MRINPKRTGCAAKARGGFTLLEILAAVFILSIVMGLVFGTFEGVFSNADRLNADSDLYEMAGACLERITADLSAIHVAQTPRYAVPDLDADPDPYRVVGGTVYSGGQSFATLRLTSLGHLRMSGGTRDGIARIVYYVEPSNNGGHVLRRSDIPFPFPDFEPNDADPIMCEQVRRFEVTYYDKEDRESDAWDSEADMFENSTPRSIAIILGVGDAEAPYSFSTEVTLPVQRQISPRR